MRRVFMGSRARRARAQRSADRSYQILPCIAALCIVLLWPFRLIGGGACRRGHHQSTRGTSTMRTPMKKILSIAAAALLIGIPAHAQVHAQDRTTEIDRIFGWVTPETPGCAVAASQNGGMVVNRAYGLADLERGAAIGSDTVFDLGSVVKQFVAASVLLLVEEGKVALSEDVRTYIPELPDTGHRVTVDHLLTHTGGIRDWTGILPLAATPTDALTIALRQRGLNFAPGEEWSYSNSGYVLLKEIVARTSGVSFGEFTQKRLFEPLGMRMTTYQHDVRDVVKNRALAYEQVD